MNTQQSPTKFISYSLWLICLLLQMAGTTTPLVAQEVSPVDATTLQHKVMCGYQGWFRCPGDGTGEGWLHWSRRRNQITPNSLTVEMWPDTSELPQEHRYPVPGFTGPDQQPAHLFSSADQATVQQHFKWMQDYGIDGVFVQRFLVNLNKPSFDTALSHVRQSAQQTGRAYAIGYDLSGAPPDRLYDMLVEDWKRLVDEATAIFKVSNDPPVQAKFQTYENLPTDWYLRLTAAGTQVNQGKLKPTAKLPISDQPN